MNLPSAALLALFAASGARVEWPTASPADVGLDAAILDG